MPKKDVRPLSERLEERVHVEESGCWTWTGSLTTDGYGQLSVDGKKAYVHRLSYVAHVGPVPPGLQIDHLCRNRACVNPAHLEPVTQRENMLRGVAARNGMCKNGHLVGDNVRIYVYGNKTLRVCLACKADRNSARKAKP